MTSLILNISNTPGIRALKTSRETTRISNLLIIFFTKNNIDGQNLCSENTKIRLKETANICTNMNGVISVGDIFE